MSQRTVPNRTAFFVIVGLAIMLILCSLVTRVVGWPRFCGGGLILVGALLALTSEEKGWPLVILLLGLAMFFGDVAVALVGGL
jgi:4-hydroxybenzoate polyprenyltransferase